jgi:hypothetical protein
VDAPVRDLAILAMIALLFVAVVLVMLLAQHRHALDDQLAEAHAQIDTLRHRLADATRPPTQFARMRVRDGAVYRFARLRRAVPRGTRRPSIIEEVRELAH